MSKYRDRKAIAAYNQRFGQLTFVEVKLPDGRLNRLLRDVDSVEDPPKRHVSRMTFKQFIERFTATQLRPERRV